jgi:hypothetical protein
MFKKGKQPRAAFSRFVSRAILLAGMFACGMAGALGAGGESAFANTDGARSAAHAAPVPFPPPASTAFSNGNGGARYCNACDPAPGFVYFSTNTRKSENVFLRDSGKRRRDCQRAADNPPPKFFAVFFDTPAQRTEPKVLFFCETPTVKNRVFDRQSFLCDIKKLE